MMTTAILPFIVQPKTDTHEVGNDKIGTLEIPRLYSLSKNEEEFISQHINTLELLTGTELAITMAVAISTKFNKSVADIGNALLSGDLDFFKENLQELFSFNRQSAENFKQRKLIMATAIIKHRLVSDWTIEDSRNPEKINPSLVEQIGNFALREQNGWALEKAEEEVEIEPEAA